MRLDPDRSRLCAARALLLRGRSAALAQWKPTKPMTIIVPWAAGGSTDQVTRVAAAEIEKHLGQKIVIVNQPGASGSIGTQERARGAEGRLHLDRRRRQGPRHLHGARHARHARPPTGTCTSRSPTSRSSASTRNSPYKTMNELLEAMKAKPGQVSVATAGVSSSGHFGDRGDRARPAASPTSTSPTTAATRPWWPRWPARPR